MLFPNSLDFHGFHQYFGTTNELEMKKRSLGYLHGNGCEYRGAIDTGSLDSGKGLIPSVNGKSLSGSCSKASRYDVVEVWRLWQAIVDECFRGLYYTSMFSEIGLNGSLHLVNLSSSPLRRLSWVKLAAECQDQFMQDTPIGKAPDPTSGVKNLYTIDGILINCIGFIFVELV